MARFWPRSLWVATAAFVVATCAPPPGPPVVTSTSSQTDGLTVVAGGVDLVLNGHRHQYERFAAIGAGGSSNPARGAREIVVGTGGKDLEAFGAAVPGSEVRLSTFGVLELTLSATEYSFRFVGIDGSVLDQGHGVCHA